MSSWAVVVVIAILVWGMIQWNKTRHGIVTDEHGKDSYVRRDDPEVQRELEELRERVKVLEKITVDGREAKQIADEIEKLRDN